MTYWPPRLVDDLKDLGFRTRDQAVEVIMRLQCERNNCDPPYPESTRTGKLYTHEMDTPDHLALLSALARIKGKFLLSSYRNSIYDLAARTHGWNRHDFKIDNKLAGGKTKKTMTECVWTNF